MKTVEEAQEDMGVRIVEMLETLPYEVQAELVGLLLLLTTTYLAQGKAVVITHAERLMSMHGLGVNEEDASILVHAAASAIRKSVEADFKEVKH